MAALIAFLFLGGYTKRVRVSGQLVPLSGLSTLMAPANGTLNQVYIREGELVKQGQPLAVIVASRITLSGDAQRAIGMRIEERRHGLHDTLKSQNSVIEAQTLGFAAQMTTAKAELRKLDTELATSKKQAALTSEELAMMRALMEKKLITKLELNRKESELLDRNSEVNAVERQALVLRRQIAQLVQSQAELPARLNAEHAAYNSNLATLQQEAIENEARGEWVITAPVTGIVSSRLRDPGQAVENGQAIMSILPEHSVLAAQLIVPSRAVGFIEVGNRVLLRYQAFPYQKFGHHAGRVTQVSRSALPSNTPELMISRTGDGDPMYRVVVTLDSQSLGTGTEKKFLRSGMLLEADIMLDHRRLIEWIFEPLYSLRKVTDR